MNVAYIVVFPVLGTRTLAALKASLARDHFACPPASGTPIPNGQPDHAIAVWGVRDSSSLGQSADHESAMDIKILLSSDNQRKRRHSDSSSPTQTSAQKVHTVLQYNKQACGCNATQVQSNHNVNM